MADLEKTMAALERNYMEAVYAETCEDVRKIVTDTLFDGCTVMTGGSVSLAESGVLDLIKSEKYRFLDRAGAGLTDDERLERLRMLIGCDFFFCSSNAVTEKGELVNVDGNSSRVAPMCFGPKRVIVVAGVNKIVRDTDEAFLRIKRIAAPKNCVRLGIDSPCARLGHCVSLERSDSPEMTDGCDCAGRICASYVVMGRQRQKNRVKVILCGENLGY